MTILLFQAQAVHDTVFVVQQKPGWQHWVEAFAAIAQIVLAIALLAVGLGVLFAAMKVKALMKKVEEQGQKLRVDLAPAIHNVTAVTENVNFVSKTVRKDAEKLSRSVTAATDKLKTAAEMAQQRVGEFNALIGVVQEEAEALFIGGASAIRGMQAGADTFRRFQTGELEYLGDVYLDEDDEYGAEEDDDGFSLDGAEGEDGDDEGDEIRSGPGRPGRRG
ncbi:DUF948 domain-containing protein [Longimicrobium sp.]|uniref:DUF948 domain-containing protein n=1 Tax=Longimicrobium sp. TaxID=2029185 RepID=UPI002CA3281B|nr:DUF948 domain-containing protein [Longimicrobium sp.]HSU13425.1 DUF948 domain-containing protein [Longimicrobium sp.]